MSTCFFLCVVFRHSVATICRDIYFSYITLDFLLHLPSYFQQCNCEPHFIFQTCSTANRSLVWNSQNREIFPSKNCSEVIAKVISLSRESVAGLRSFLLEQTAAGGDKAVLQYVTNLLNGNVGFLFNERFINIPAQVGFSWSWQRFDLRCLDHRAPAGDSRNRDEEG